ncbi:MAG TPA: DEAD/DEAH box helicase [Casimicrobiaceae bacterium]|nr:DEAD/DEAH box helicase [Casimicrobiaceae bacterium]
MRFEELNLAPALLRALEECGYAEPTPIQAQTIPPLIGGQDVIGSAQTGTGKTAAFVLPALHRLALSAGAAPPPKRRSAGMPRVLVLAPTRELAQQVAQQAVRYAQHLRVRVVCLYGGAPYPHQIRELQHGVDVLVATPGRLIDHIERGRVDLSGLEMLVLDEADRMLDMGFSEDVERICGLTPASRQTVLFSATIDGPIARLAGRLTRDAVRIDVRAAGSGALAIDQCVHFADDRAHKHRLLDHVLSDVSLKQSIVFIATQRDAETLALRLQDAGHAVAALHGGMSQRERNSTLTKLRRGGVRTLVATDVAARGIDVASITHVINFDLPRQADDYVHRIGRTGRAGATGTAVSFANHSERGTLRMIERAAGQPIPARVIPGLEPRARSTGRDEARRPGFAKAGANHRHGKGGQAAARRSPSASSQPRWRDR